MGPSYPTWTLTIPPLRPLPPMCAPVSAGTDGDSGAEAVILAHPLRNAGSRFEFRAVPDARQANFPLPYRPRLRGTQCIRCPREGKLML